MPSPPLRPFRAPDPESPQPRRELPHPGAPPLGEGDLARLRAAAAAAAALLPMLARGGTLAARYPGEAGEMSQGVKRLLAAARRLQETEARQQGGEGGTR